MKIKISDITIPDERARASYTDEQHTLLEASLAKYGQLSDVLVRPLEKGKYELIDGESRVKQLLEAGIPEIDVKIIDLNDKDANMVNILMNIARGTQDPMGVCLALTKAQASGMNPDDMAVATGHTVAWVKFMLMLANLPDVYQEALRRNDIKVGHVREAFRLPNPQEIDACLGVALRQKLPVRVIKTYVENRLAEFEISQRMESKYGVDAPPPIIDPQRLTQNVQCLAHGGMVPREDVSLPRLCNDCYTFLKYATSQIGTGQQAMDRLFEALRIQQQFVQQQEDFMTRRMMDQATIQPTQPQPEPTTSATEDLDMIIKPADMSEEEWGALKAALKKR